MEMAKGNSLLDPLAVADPDLDHTALHFHLAGAILNLGGGHPAKMVLDKNVPQILILLRDLLACPERTLAPLGRFPHRLHDEVIPHFPHIFLRI